MSNIFSEKQINEMIDLLCGLDEKTTKIYIGTDSSRYKREKDWYAKYVSVLVVHKNGKNGCKIFRSSSEERVYDVKHSKPSMRLMREVQLTCELYLQVAPFIDCFDVQIHVDVNLDPKHGSNCVAKEAAGYVLGMTGMEAHFKPDALCASFGADHYT